MINRRTLDQPQVTTLQIVEFVKRLHQTLEVLIINLPAAESYE